MQLQGRGSIVTGGGRGIGAAIAAALARAGATVIVAARTSVEIESIAAALRAGGARAFAVPCDVTDPESVESLVATAVASAGGVDILVNNAGVASSAPLARTSLEEWQRVLAINATGTFLCSRAVVPSMVERGWGRVVNIASVAALGGARYIAAYAASKHAVLGLTRCVAAELEGSGVTANVVCPGYVDTPMTRESARRIVAKTGLDEAAALRAMLDSAGQPRMIDATEVAAEVVRLCGDDAAMTSGEAIVIDGSER